MKDSIKMVVTDLDGTLLRDDKTISEYTASVIKALRAKGILFTIATARPIRAVTEFLPFLEYDCAIYHNGAIVHDGKSPLDGFGIDNPGKTIHKILCDMPGSHIAVEANDAMFSNFDAERLWPGIQYEYTTDFSEVTFADKIIVEATSAAKCTMLSGYIPSDLYLIPSENSIAMIMNKNAKKSSGIASLAGAHGFGLDNVVAFGDDFNDIDMLKACGFGVAVENALPEVKSFAEYICSSNMEDGVASWIEKNLLQ